MPEMSPLAVGLLVALGCGTLIGLERERRKGEGDDRAAAGLRSFIVAAGCGALAQGLGRADLVLAGALLVIVLAALAYARSRSRDPGLTTELALFATYLVGVQSMLAPAVGAACGAGLAVLLAARQRLHRFATRVLSVEELHDTLMLAALGLVVLPLVPNAPQAWLAGINPYPLAALVLLILLLQGIGHAALRIAGPRFGLAASGFFSGFVSSTAAIASLGGRARHDLAHGRSLAGAAVLSSAATWVQVMLMAAALSTEAARRLAPVVVSGLLCALGVGALLFAKAAPAASAPTEATARRPLRLREALIVAALLSTVTLIVSLARQQLGAGGVFATAAVAGLADAHSPVASVVALFAGGRLTAHEMLLCVLLAVSANSAVRVFTAFAAGGSRYGARVAAGLLLALAAAWAAASALA
jgi:uncharacterized membrane protein (DUF4010 family)